MAILEKGTDEVVCGYFASGHGRISIVNEDEDVEVFTKDDVEILGKIVGYANPHEVVDGRLLAKPLKNPEKD